ncbi:MAG: hypothetical protein IIA14_03615 [SAR324 cluster bacterium]|nr:hypothetical protein [SAR324 cluster bacterium]
MVVRYFSRIWLAAIWEWALVFFRFQTKNARYPTIISAPTWTSGLRKKAEMAANPIEPIKAGTRKTAPQHNGARSSKNNPAPDPEFGLFLLAIFLLLS